MAETCGNCDHFDGSDSTCHWMPPPVIRVLAQMATQEPASHINHTSAFDGQMFVHADMHCSCWKPSII
jgi:hypothetical protein